MLNSSRTRHALTALIGGMLTLAAGQEVAPTVAVVVKVKGGVFCQAPGSEQWADAAAGRTLVSGEQMKTDADGLAMLRFVSDGSMMRLRPQTHLTFAARNEGGVLMRLGAALFDVKSGSGAEDFTVTTPTGVATVKGTRFWVSCKEDSTSSISVLDGTVQVACTITGKTRRVRAGSTALLGPGGLQLRQSRAEDIPERSQVLEFEFKDADGTSRTLRIDAVQQQ